MDQPEKTFTSDGANAGNWIGKIIVAVILGEAIWSLIVSLMNNLVVPWLGDVMGQSSGLPTSFTQRPYDYPDLFVSVVEFCIAGLVAAILNHFFQRSKARMKRVQLAAEPIRIVPAAATATAQPLPAQPAPVQISSTQIPSTQIPSTQTPPARTSPTQPSPVHVPSVQAPLAPVTSRPAVKVSPVAPPAAVVATPAAQVPVTAPAPKPVAAAPAPAADNSVAKTPPPPPKPESPKPKKPKQVYYNIVGEPVSSDED